MKLTKRSLALLAFTGITIAFLLMHNITAFAEVRGDLNPKGQVNSIILLQRFDITWDGTKPGTPMRINLSPNTEIMEFRSTQKVSLYVLKENETKGLNSSGDMTKFNPQVSSELQTWINKTYILESNLTYLHFINDWGLKGFTTTSKDNKTTYNVIFYILIVNEYSGYTQYSLKWQTPHAVVTAMDTLFGNLVFIVFFAVGAMLFYRSYKERKNPERKPVANMYKNFAIAFVAGGIGTFDWQFFGLWSGIDPALDWSGILTFKSMPMWVLGGALSASILTFITFICLGASISFMSNTIERNIQNKKIPYLTYLLWIMELLIIGFAFGVAYAPSLEVTFGVIIYAWLAALILVAINIVIVYVKIIMQSSGMLKKKSLVILIPLLITYLSMIAIRIFVSPQFIANALASFFAIVMYKGLTMD